MRSHRQILTAGLLLCAALCAIAGAQPGGIAAPDAGIPAIQPGADTITFSGAPVALADAKFVAKGYKTVAKLRRGSAAKIAEANWAADQGLKMKSAGPASLKCRIPEEAGGLVLFYSTPRGSTTQPTVSLNGSEVSLWTVEDRPYECLLRFTRESGKVQFDGEPIMNLWDLRGNAPGINFDETHCEIAVDHGYDPLTSGEYRCRVSYVANERRIASPNVPCYTRLYGLDVTQFDGYIVKFKAPDARYFYASMLDSNNFSWSGAGRSMYPGEWTSLAIPFEVHHNYTTAGDGVLKLSQLTRITCGISRRPADSAPTGEYVVAAPKFYKGDPPKNIEVAEARPRALCAIRSLAPERRKTHALEGISIQAIREQGDFVWLGTDRGVYKNSRTEPDLKIAEYGLAEGLVDDDIQYLHVDGDALWIGTTCGVSRFDGEKFQNFTMDEGLLPGPVMAIASDDQYVWMAMARGVARYDKSSGEITARKGRGGWSPESTGGQGVPVQEGRGIYADSIAVDPTDGSVWHAAAGLAHSRRKDARQLSHFLGTTKRVLSVYPLEEEVAIVSNRAIELVSKEDGQVTKAFGIGSRKGMGLGRHTAFITCVYPEKDRIWLGYSDGVGWFDVAEKRCHWSPYYSVKMGSLVPQCIFADSRTLWVGTDNGLMVFPLSKANESWRTLEYSAPTDLWAAGVNLDVVVPNPDDCETCIDFGPPQNVSLDDEGGSPGSPGALLLEFDFGRDADDEACLAQRFDIDLPQTNGIRFRAKTDAPYKGQPREFFVDVHLTAKAGKQTRRVVLRQAVRVHPEWRGFTLDFAKMRPVSGSGRIDSVDPGSVHLTGVDVRRSVADHHCPGDKGKLWFDKLELVGRRGSRA